MWILCNQPKSDGLQPTSDGAMLILCKHFRQATSAFVFDAGNTQNAAALILGAQAKDIKCFFSAYGWYINAKFRQFKIQLEIATLELFFG